MGVYTLLYSLPCRSPSPGLPWAAGEPQIRAESLGVAGIEDTVRSVTLRTATCGRRQRWGGLRNSRGTVQPWPWGSGGPRSQQNPAVSGDLGLTGVQNVIRSVTLHNMPQRTVILSCFLPPTLSSVIMGSAGHKSMLLLLKFHRGLGGAVCMCVCARACAC